MKDVEYVPNLDDSICVSLMVEYLHLVAAAREIPLNILEGAKYLSLSSICDTHTELELREILAGSLAAMIVGRKTRVNQESDLMSIAEYLTNCSAFGFIVPFLFRYILAYFFSAQYYRNYQDSVKDMFMLYMFLTMREVHDINRLTV